MIDQSIFREYDIRGTEKRVRMGKRVDRKMVGMGKRVGTERKKRRGQTGRYFSCHFLRAIVVSDKFPVRKMRQFQVQNMQMRHQLSKLNY
jgi:hypothetical protein